MPRLYGGGAEVAVDGVDAGALLDEELFDAVEKLAAARSVKK